MPTRKKKEPEFIYRICRAGPLLPDTYLIKKIIPATGIVVDVYNTTLELPNDPDDAPEKLWCDCLGFRMQKYNKMRHKHVKIVLAYLALGQPPEADFTLTGSGEGTIARHIGVKT